MFSIIIAIVFPIAGAHIILSRFLTGHFPRINGSVLTVSLSAGLVPGVTSCAYFLWLLFLGVPSVDYRITEGTLIVILISIALFTSKYHNSDRCLTDIESEYKIFLRLLSVGALITIICFIAAFLLRSAVNPHGWEDAWGMWNLKARFIFRSGDNWRIAFSNLLKWSSLDYPLMVPLSIVRIWSYSGNEFASAQIAIAALFTFSTASLLISSLSVIRSRSSGLLAGLILVGSPYFLKTGAYQIADIPLGFYILSATVFFYLAGGSGLKSRFLIAAGLMAGFAAWTKNEGILYLLVVFLVRLIIVSGDRGIRAYLQELAMSASGALPVLVVVLLFKSQIPPSNELFVGQSMEMFWERLTDLSRYAVIGKSFIVYSYDKLAKEWLLVLPAYILLVGRAKRKENAEGIKTAFLSVLLMFGGYFFIYLITPLNLQWHIDTSIWRLFLQLWPTVIFTFFAYASTPEEMFNEKRRTAS